jgi:alanine racemase
MAQRNVPSVQWIEVDAAALEHNLRLFRNILRPETALLAVVKANAYGHGMPEIAPRASRIAPWLGVHSASEARQLRRLGVENPILVMGFVPNFDFHDLDKDVHLLVSSVKALEWVKEYRERTRVALPVHVKVDVGTKRQGISEHELPAFISSAREARVDVVGIASHFANIEDTIEHDFARHQLERFHSTLDVAKRVMGALPPLIHASCSAAALLFRETDFTLSRSVFRCMDIGPQGRPDCRGASIIATADSSCSRCFRGRRWSARFKRWNEMHRSGTDGRGLREDRVNWQSFLSVTRTGIRVA